jgi:hypothetical protein
MTRKIIAAGVCALVGFGCRGAAEAQADALCARAETVERTDPRAALELRRAIWEEMPTAGTAGARRCLRTVRERMGQVRVRVSEDREGGEEAVAGCAWVAETLEVFEGVAAPPFRLRWAGRLMERCKVVVGRAWARRPDDPALIALDRALTNLAERHGPGAPLETRLHIAPSCL